MKHNIQTLLSSLFSSAPFRRAGRRAYWQRAGTTLFHMLAIVLVLVSNFGPLVTPAKAASAEIPVSNPNTSKQPKNNYNAPVLTHPKARTGSAAEETESHEGEIACMSTSIDQDAAVGCDHEYATTIHLHNPGLATNDIRYNISDPGGNKIYFSISASFSFTPVGQPVPSGLLLFPSPLYYLANHFDWEVGNVLGGTSGHSQGQTNPGSFSYKASGSIEPGWWNAFSVHHDLGGLWPYDIRRINSVDITISTEPLDGIPPESTNCNDCSPASQAQNYVGDPINTFSGGFNLPVDDISIATSSGQLALRRNYSSQAKSRYDLPFSPGWSHSLDNRLIFPGDPAGMPGYVLFKSPTGNTYRFEDKGDGVYTPYKGVLATLTRNNGSPVTYTVRDSDQNVFDFNQAGRIQTKADGEGRTFNYTYDSNGKLAQVTADGDGRFLHFTYDDDKLVSVEDHTERSVSYDYDPSTGDLTSVTDVLGNTWRYFYDSTHNLTEVKDPENVTKVRNEYAPDESGRNRPINFNDGGFSPFRLYIGSPSDGLIACVGTSIVQDETMGCDHKFARTIVLTNPGLWNDVRYSILDPENEVVYYTITATYQTLHYRRPCDGPCPPPACPQYLQHTFTGEIGNVLNGVSFADTPRPCSGTYTYSKSGSIDPGWWGSFSVHHDLWGAWPYDGAKIWNVRIMLSVDPILHRNGEVTSNNNMPALVSVPQSSGLSLASHRLPAPALQEDTATPTSTPSPTETATIEAPALTETPTATPTLPPTDTVTATATAVPADTETPTLTATAAPADTATATPTPSIEAETPTETPTETATETPTPTHTATETHTPTPTPEPVLMLTPDVVVEDDGLTVHITGDGWERFSLPYEITDSTILEFDYKSTEEGAVQGIGFDQTPIDWSNIYQLYGTEQAGDNTFNNYADSAPAWKHYRIRIGRQHSANNQFLYFVNTDHRTVPIAESYFSNIRVYDEIASGKVARQYNGKDYLVAALDYQDNGKTIITNALGDDKIDTYDKDTGVLLSETDALGKVTKYSYGANFRPKKITDPAGHVTKLTYSNDGANLLKIIDAAGYVATFTYDNRNNLTSTTSGPNHYLTTFEYDGTLLTRKTDALNGETSFTYSSAGFLESVTDPRGNATTYTNNTHGLRASTTDPIGDIWYYSYDALGRLVNITDPLGRITHNEYDDAGQLVKTTRNYNPAHPQNDQNVFNIVTSYEYDVRGHPVLITDTYGHTTQFEYDAADRLIQTTNADGKVTTNTYNEAGQLVMVTDPLQHSTQYEYDPVGRQDVIIDALNHATRTAYNPDGTIDWTKDALNHKTQYEYDDLKHVIEVIDPEDNSIHATYDESGHILSLTDALNHTTHFTYDALGHQLTKTDPLGGVTENFYDEAGNLIQVKDPRQVNDSNLNATDYEYDDANRLIKVTNALGEETQYDYDTLGNVVTVTAPNGKSTTYGYDALNRAISETDPLSHVKSLAYDAVGNVISLTDPNQNITTFGYDNLYLQTSICAGGTPTQACNSTTSYDYDDAGNRISVTDPNGHTTTLGYDALNRPISSTDALSRVTGVTYNAIGQVHSTKDALNNETIFGYDALGRKASVTDPLGNKTRYDYDIASRLTDMWNAKDVNTHYEYDDLGRLWAVTENYIPLTQPDEQTNVTTHYTYDENGNRLTIEDANGHTTHFYYDALNRLSSETDPLNHTWQYEYNSLGQRSTVTDANGTEVSYTYDDAGRLTNINYPNTNADVALNLDPAGRITQMTDALGQTSWQYDTLNRPTGITDPFGKTVGYQYDPAGNRTGLTYPSATGFPNGKPVSYTYDAANQLSQVTDWNQQATTYDYYSTGRLQSVSRPNGVGSSYHYDEAGQLTLLQHSDTTTGALSSFEYIYDAAGNRQQAIESVVEPILPSPTPTQPSTQTPTPTATPTITETITPTETGTVTATPTLTPTPTAAPGGASISAGGYHTCALTGSGGVKCWGSNTYGQLGDGTTTQRTTPVDVNGLTSGVAAIAAGGFHTCALTTSGGIKCWGRNNTGQLGDGTETQRLTPVNVSGLTSGVAAISASGFHTCAVTTSGGVKCWGANDYGKLGDGTTTKRSTPVNVSGLTSGVTDVIAAPNHTCALTTGGGVKCWGVNVNGRLGDGTTTDSSTPVDVSGLTSGVIAITADSYSCALTTGGGVKCWGRGPLGDGTTSSRLTPVDVSGLTSGVTAIDSGSEYACALTTGGGVKCWPRNDYGQLGDGTTTQRLTPVDVSGLTSGVTAITAGIAHACALTTSGVIKCWGLNSSGQLGDGTTTNSTTPVDVSGTATPTPTVTSTPTETATVTPTSTDAQGGYHPSGNLQLASFRLRRVNDDEPTLTPTETPTITITPTPVVFSPGTYDDNLAGMNYVGSWTLETLSGPYSNTFHQTPNNNDYVEFHILGSSIQFFYPETSYMGKFDFTLDGTHVADLDLHHDSLIWDGSSPVFTFSYGNHTVRLTKLDATQVILDKFIVGIAPTPTPTQTPTSTPSTCTTWNLANDFRASSNHENPNRDSCNNLGVWSFMKSSSLTRDPANYSLMSSFVSNGADIAGYNYWYADGIPPYVSFNATGNTLNFGAMTFPPNTIAVHPSSGQLSIMAWHSPINGYVTITGGVNDDDPGGGDGIQWYIDKNSTNLASGGYANGSSQSFANGAGGASLHTVAVSVGDVIYLSIHPKDNYYYDSTGVDLTISVTTSPTVTPTPSTCSSWDVTNDFRTAPQRENPNRDSCNNLDVWKFMESPSLTRDPANYSLMTSFTDSFSNSTGLNAWTGTYSSQWGYYPIVGLNTNSSIQEGWPTDQILVHPAPNQMAILAWRSPVNGYVSITGGVTDRAPGGGDGILWYIDRNATSLASGGYNNSGSQTFANGTDGSNLHTVAVSVGDMIYLVVHPKDGYGGDSTGVDLTISVTDPPTPTITPTVTETPTVTQTATITLTPTITPTSTKTPTITKTATLTRTPRKTATPTATETLAPTITPTKTITPTRTPFSLTPIPGLRQTVIDYTYDPLNRLKTANYTLPGGSSDGSYEYAYDAAGNRLSQEITTGGTTVTTGYTYDNANRLISAGGQTHTWDNNGNLLSDGANTYSYDPANRLTSINNSVSFAYNGLGQRLRQTIGSTTTNYTLDINTSLPQVLSDGANDYLYGLERIAQINAGSSNAAYFLTDALGSMRQMTDAGGAVTLARAYDPFGQVRANIQSPNSPATIFGYTGEQTDSTGLVYLRARYYDPTRGRFTSRDTWPGISEQPQSLNRYAYVLNNPILYTDPNGNCGPLCVIGIAGLAGGLLMGGASIFDQLQKNGGRWGCINWRDVLVSGATGVMMGAAIAINVVTLGAGLGPDYFLDLGIMLYDIQTGADIDTLFFDAASLLLPGVSSAFTHADDFLRAGSHLDDVGDAMRAGGSHLDDIGDGMRTGFGCNSFTADTLVKTETGERPISEIKVGDKVLAYNEETGTTGYYPVEATISHEDPAVERLVIDDEEIITTPEHPFYTREHGWTDAKDLQPGDHIRKANGAFGVVKSVTIEKSPRRMYNLTVAGAHTFFVGGGQWLVHNVECNPLLPDLVAPRGFKDAQQFRQAMNELDNILSQHGVDDAMFRFRGSSTTGLSMNPNKPGKWFKVSPDQDIDFGIESSKLSNMLYDAGRSPSTNVPGLFLPKKMEGALPQQLLDDLAGWNQYWTNQLGIKDIKAAVNDPLLVIPSITDIIYQRNY